MEPDLDAVASVWIFKRFGGEQWMDAQVVFVPSGSTLKDMPPDADADIVHVDTGLGELDHHLTNDYVCSALLVYKKLNLADPALKRLVDLVVLVDHAKDLLWEDIAEDKWEMWLPALLTGYRLLYKGQYEKQMDFGFEALDAAYKSMRNKVEAEQELGKCKEFTTKWGSALGCLTYNDGVLDVGLKRKYTLVVRKDPGKGYIRVTGRVDKGVDLSSALEQFKIKDPKATWYLHPSKVLLRNGSTKNPKMRPTNLTLDQVIDILEAV